MLLLGLLLFVALAVSLLVRRTFTLLVSKESTGFTRKDVLELICFSLFAAGRVTLRYRRIYKRALRHPKHRIWLVEVVCARCKSQRCCCIQRRADWWLLGWRTGRLTGTAGMNTTLRVRLSMKQHVRLQVRTFARFMTVSLKTDKMSFHRLVELLDWV